jgi:hypothetical protein
MSRHQIQDVNVGSKLLLCQELGNQGCVGYNLEKFKTVTLCHDRGWYVKEPSLLEALSAKQLCILAFTGNGDIPI